MNRFLDKNGNPITGLLAEVRDEIVVNQIESEMLDGTVTVQIIGDARIMLSIVFYTSTVTRREIEQMLQNGDRVTVEWHEETYNGFLSGKTIAHEKFWPKITDRQEKLKLTVSVSEE